MQTVCIQPRSGTNSAASMQNNMPVWGGESSTSPETVPIKKRPRAGRKGSLTSELVRVSPRFALYKSGRIVAHGLPLHCLYVGQEQLAVKVEDLKRRLKSERGLRKSCEKWMRSELKSREATAL
eukprot:scaffold43147_cov21-Tisochrysis_lutea.AAC.1